MTYLTAKDKELANAGINPVTGDPMQPEQYWLKGSSRQPANPNKPANVLSVEEAKSALWMKQAFPDKERLSKFFPAPEVDALLKLQERTKADADKATGITEVFPAPTFLDQPASTESLVAKLRGDVLDRARQAVCVDRAKTHGDAEQSFEAIAAYWSTHLGHPVSALDVPIMMTLFKCARARSNPTHLDNYDDMAGYAAIGGQMAGVPPKAK